KKDPRRFYMMATLVQDADGVPAVTAQAKQSSALLGTQNASNCLLLFPEDCTALAAGEMVDCYLI
ncbi:MAG: molybdopterin molybdenumtransferase MoeA, partial [Coriobacteriaceae bacterium]|nr:molybdopterin molybdenumtransferase MoeA [Coriobacteriaceae bacterium]